MKYVSFFCLFLTLRGLNLAAQEELNAPNKRCVKITSSKEFDPISCLAIPPGSQNGPAAVAVFLGMTCYSYIKSWKEYCKHGKTISSFFKNKETIKEYDVEIIINEISHFLTIPASQKIVKTIISFIEEKTEKCDAECKIFIVCKIKVVTLQDRKFLLKPFHATWSKNDENKEYKIGHQLSWLFVLENKTHLSQTQYFSLLSLACCAPFLITFIIIKALNV